MRLHVVNLPHTQTTRAYNCCAYTAKVRKFCDMMAPRHEIILYAGDENAAQCAELVNVASRKWQARHGFEGPEDYQKIEWDGSVAYWREHNLAVIGALVDLVEPGDIVCVMTGDPVAMLGAIEARGAKVVEIGVGYQGIHFGHRVFESHAWRHAVYSWKFTPFGSFVNECDAVIHNYFDPADFGPADRASEGFVLYLGRLLESKGWRIAQDAAEKAGVPFVAAGPGPDTFSGYGEHVGIVGEAERRDLLRSARALMVPTQYLGPFEGVHVEAMLSGCPVITSDFGVFVETVESGRDGYRCRTMSEYLFAIEQSALLNRKAIRHRALNRFSLDVIGPQYDEYLERVRDA